MSSLILRALTEGDEAAFLQGLQEWAGEAPGWHTFIWKPGMAFADMLARLRDDARGLNLAEGRVPHSMFYGFVGGAIVGRVSVRHQLNERLLRRDGHLGYAVAPRFRQKGYATEMVRQALQYCREGLGLSELLLTCNDNNESSWRVIEKAGGKFERKFYDDQAGEWVRRYWLKL
jgi:predicted acetyltransferase